MTGAYFRVERGGKFEAIEIENLTSEERTDTLAGKDTIFLLSCIDALSKKLAECESILKENGIIEVA